MSEAQLFDYVGIVPVDERSFARRTSYGPSSPVVGARGARTRQQIVEGALKSFTERGFHATAVEDIAALADTSRATLYQYFESKEAIFIELMTEAGTALMGVTRRLGLLGPTAEGFDHLHWWLSEWASVFDRYSSMFIEWANINSPRAPLRQRLAQFVEVHTGRFSDSLRKAGFSGDDPHVISLLVLGVTSRYNYIRHVYRPGLADRQLLDSLAIAFQLLLFPETPLAILDAGPLSSKHDGHRSDAGPPAHAIGPLADLPQTDDRRSKSPFDGLGTQAVRTVRQLLDAAGNVFADCGYDAANIDLIVTEANLARGTFYRYFDDKLELMVALADDCARDMHGPFERLAALGPGVTPAELRQWLHEFLVLHDRYAGVMRAWTEGFPIDPQVLVPCRDTVVDVGLALRSLFGPRRTYALDRRAAGMMLAALLEQFPNEGKGTPFEPSADQIVDAQALFIERVLLAR
jgi:AcrR family transcriptional regulator